MSSVDSKKNADRIRAVKKRSKVNQICMDCSQRAPSSVVLDYGTFVCTQCAGVHREFNHRVKGISMSTFTSDEVAHIEQNGNDQANKLWRAKWSPDDFPKPAPGNVDQIRHFIRATYSDKRWYKEKRSRRKAAPVSDDESSESSEEEEETPRPQKKKSHRAHSRMAHSSAGSGSSRTATPVQHQPARAAIDSRRAASATTTADFDLLSQSLPKQPEPSPIPTTGTATSAGGVWAEFDESFDANGFPDEPTAVGTTAHTSPTTEGLAAAMGVQQQRHAEKSNDDISSLSALGVASSNTMILTPKQLMAAERLEELIRVLRAQLGVEPSAMVSVCDEASRRFRADPLRAAKPSSQLPKDHAAPAQNSSAPHHHDAPLLTSPRQHTFEVNPFASADAGGIGSPAHLARNSPFGGNLGQHAPGPLTSMGVGNAQQQQGAPGALPSPFSGLGGRPTATAPAPLAQLQAKQHRAPAPSSNPFEMASDDDEDDMGAHGGAFGAADDPFGGGAPQGVANGGAYAAQPRQQPVRAASSVQKPQQSALFDEFNVFPS